MEFIKPNTNIDFVGNRKYAYIFSGTLLILTILSLIVHGGPEYGIDFSGGTMIHVKFDSAVNSDVIKNSLATLGLTRAVIQTFGDAKSNEYLIRSDVSTEELEGLSERTQQLLAKDTNTTVEIRRLEMVGPQVGKDLREKALFAIYYSLLFIAIYISGRFEFKWVVSGIMAFCLMGLVQSLSFLHVSIPILIILALIITLVLFWYLDLRFAMGAIVALIHDVTITVGVFSLTEKEFSLPIVAALLTIIGYSLNDTIIVFDRIRENMKRYMREPLGVIINKSVNETLSRTILTSGTTLLALIALLIFGGGIMVDFAFAMIVGVVIGTYSSVYVASPILLEWADDKKKIGLKSK